MYFVGGEVNYGDLVFVYEVGVGDGCCVDGLVDVV